MRNRDRRSRGGIRFDEIAKRITGISTPIFGVSWQPPSLEVEVARRLLTYLEDRRVLYVDYFDERLRDVVESVIQIRARLTDDLEHIDRCCELAKSISSMRAASRRFLNEVQRIETRKVLVSLYHSRGNETAAYFFGALGELRATFGIHIAQIAVRHGIDLEKSLASILPADSTAENP